MCVYVCIRLRLFLCALSEFIVITLRSTRHDFVVVNENMSYKTRSRCSHVTSCIGRRATPTLNTRHQRFITMFKNRMRSRKCNLNYCNSKLRVYYTCRGCVYDNNIIRYIYFQCAKFMHAVSGVWLDYDEICKNQEG